MMTLFGGAGTVCGPMLGAATDLIIRNVLSTLTDSASLVRGCLFEAIVLLFRRGLIGEVVHLVAQRDISGPRDAGGDLQKAD